MTVTAPPRTLVLARSWWCCVVLAVSALFVVGFRVSRSPDDGPNDRRLPAPPATECPPATRRTPTPARPRAEPPAGPSYALTAAGIRGFLATYQKKFHTTRVVDLTFYGDYVIVDVPVPGKARQEGWLFRDGTWTGFGGVRATFPGSGIVDTSRLDVPALMRNIARARRTLTSRSPRRPT